MQSLIGALCTATLGALALVAFGAVFGRLHPAVDLLGHFLLPAVAIAAALALVAALTSRYATAALAVGALLANLAILWPWVQPPVPVPAEGPRFKLLLLNVYYHNPRLDIVVDLVRRSRADIVVLLEMVPRIRPHLDAPAAEYPYRLECWQGHLCDALILSRFPLTDIAATLPAPQTRRSLASVSVDIDGRALSLFAAHLTLPFPFNRFDAQPEQADDVAATIAAAKGPRLLVGDFNAATWGATMSKQRDAGLEALTGPGGSWPTFLPKQLGIPIDHVFASDELALVSRRLFTVYGSDHRAVLAEIAFRD